MKAKKLKQIVNVNYELLREEEMTEEEASKYSELIVVDSSDGSVLCDFCCKDFTHSTLSGGFTFRSYATCPECVSQVYTRAVMNGETDQIKYVCPGNMSFADWVRNVLRKEHREEGKSEFTIEKLKGD